MWESYYGPRHSKRDALTNREFELLLQAARELDDYQSLQARFVIFMPGRLGMRKGELAHMTQNWVDDRRNMIRILHLEELVLAEAAASAVGGTVRVCSFKKLVGRF